MVQQGRKRRRRKRRKDVGVCYYGCIVQTLFLLMSCLWSLRIHYLIHSKNIQLSCSVSSTAGVGNLCPAVGTQLGKLQQVSLHSFISQLQSCDVQCCEGKIRLFACSLQAKWEMCYHTPVLGEDYFVRPFISAGTWGREVVLVYSYKVQLKRRLNLKTTTILMYIFYRDLGEELTPETLQYLCAHFYSLIFLITVNYFSDSPRTGMRIQMLSW